MKDLAKLHITYGIPDMIGEEGGAFSVTVRGQRLTVIASHGLGWDHVSVSTPHRCPTWDEMEAIKRIFFEEHETAMQLHVPPDDHISFHPYTLHMWRPHEGEIPRPP